VVAEVTTMAGAGDATAAIVKSRTMVKGPPQLAASFILERAQRSPEGDISGIVGRWYDPADDRPRLI
jgi:hypothetical protein